MMTQTLKNRVVSLPTFSSAQIDGIKLLAFIAMVADHANTAFNLHNDWLLLIGRIAFPLFAVIWGMNQARHNQIKQASLNRLWIWAVLAQPGYALVVMHSGAAVYQLNILFTFAVAGQSLRWLQVGQLSEKIKAICLTVIYLPFSLTSYFIFGLLLLWFSYYMFKNNPGSCHFNHLAAWCSLVIMLNIHIGILFAAGGLILSLFLVSVLQGIRRDKRFLPGYFFLAGYAGHLMFLGIINQ